MNIGQPITLTEFRLPTRRGLPSSPRNPAIHLFETQDIPYLFVVNGSRLYALGRQEYADFQAALVGEDGQAVSEKIAAYGLDASPYIGDEPLVEHPVRGLSLAVSQKCNLGCTYCYAEGGSFGGAAKNMPLQTALDAVERLFAQAAPGERVNLTFLGGEPLLNRTVIRAATEYATTKSATTGIPVGFSITTNGTLLTADDGAFFERHGFAVTISLDGVGEIHDRQRAYKNGRGSYAHTMERVRPLLAAQRKMQISARVTVTPHNLGLRATLDALIEMGFHSVGFSPMLSSPTGYDELGSAELDLMLSAMIDCGQKYEQCIVAGTRYPFANMVNAMKEIHHGTHRPYPCGAGAGYFGVCSMAASMPVTVSWTMPSGPWAIWRMVWTGRRRPIGWGLGMSIFRTPAATAGRGTCVAEAAIMK